MKGDIFLMQPEKYTQQTLNTLKKVLQDHMSTWTGVINKDFDTLRNVYKGYYQKIEKLSGEDSPRVHFISELETCLNDIQKWKDDISQIPDKTGENGLWLKWQEAFKKILEDIPESIDLEFAENFWLKNPSDPWKVRLWKVKNRWQIGLKTKWYRILNLGRKLLRKPPKSIAPRTRTVQAHHFMKMYAERPAIDSIFLRWQNFLQRLSRYLVDLHTAHEEIKDRLLFLGDSPTTCREKGDQNITEYAAQVDQTLQKINGIQQELKKFSGADFSDTACGAWQAGPAQMMKISGRCSAPSSWAATSSIPPGPMARVTAKSCWASWSGPTGRSSTPPQDPAQESAVAEPARRYAGRCFPPDHIEEYVRRSLDNAGWIARPDAVPRLGGRLGR